MESRVRVLKHPLHPMLVMFPVALFPLLVLLDVLHALDPDAGLATAAFWVTALGVATTLAAIVPGLVDLRAIPDGSKAHRTAVVHTIFGLAVLALYAIGLSVRWPVGSEPRFALAVGADVLGLVAITIQGWLGGELVYHHHIGVRSREEGGEPTPLETAGPRAPRVRAGDRGASRP